MPLSQPHQSASDPSLHEPRQSQPQSPLPPETRAQPPETAHSIAHPIKAEYSLGQIPCVPAVYLRHPPVSPPSVSPRPQSPDTIFSLRCLSRPTSYTVR